MSEIKKRYFVIALTVILVCAIFGDQIFKSRDLVQDAIEQEQHADSLMLVAQEKVQRIQDIQDMQHDDQHHIDSLDMMILQHNRVGVDTEALRFRLEALKKKQQRYDSQLVTLMEDTATLRHTAPHVVHRDSIVYNVIEKDTVVYNVIEKDTVIHNTVYVTDTVLVDPKYLKNKFRKNR